MSIEQTIETFLKELGTTTVREELVDRYFLQTGLSPSDAYSVMESISGFHHINGKVWFDRKSVRIII